MKGVLFLHLRSFVQEEHPAVSWRDALSECGIAQIFSAGWDYPDPMLFCLVSVVCRRAGVAQEEFWYRFGRHSMYEFRKNYRWYFDQNADARSMLLSANDIHADAVRDIKGAKPPRFTGEAGRDSSEIVLTYTSERGMADYVRGAIDGILEIYLEKADVTLERREENDATFRIRFRSER